jgi:transposase
MGRPGLPPGMYFRLLLIGYFEGIDSSVGTDGVGRSV